MFLFEVLSSPLIYKLTILALTATVLLTLASQFGDYLYLELATHFRLQYVAVAIICAGSLTVFQSWKFLPIALACALLNASHLFPYFSSKTEINASSAHLRVLHANVLKDNQNYRAVFALITENNPDVVVLQEITESWDQQVKFLQAKYPYYKSAPAASGAGMALFSRYRLRDLKVLQLDASTHLAILAEIDISGQPVTILALHPPTPITPNKFANRNRQFREAASLLNSMTGPKVLIGDLNTTMWSPYFVSLTRSTGLRDARLGFGLQTSWPVPLPAILRLPIDHCLVSEEVQVSQLRLGAPAGSDHCPLIVDLIL